MYKKLPVPLNELHTIELEVYQDSSLLIVVYQIRYTINMNDSPPCSTVLTELRFFPVYLKTRI